MLASRHRLHDANPVGANVREALPSDIARICALAMQLGYDVTPEHIERRLAARNGEREVFVAIVPRVGAIGWIGVAVREAMLGERRTEIEGLVVEDEYRSNGVGAMLLARAEQWAKANGCTTVRLLANILRERAHTFYLDNGYDILKSEHVFEKKL